MVSDAGARPAFKGYYVPAAGKRYPCVLCTSINEEVVHGIPSRKRVLKEGDIVKIDIGVELNGYYGDSATTVAVGRISAETERLMRVTREALQRAIEQMRAGGKLFDVCGAVQQHVEQNGFSVVREFVGHGIGTKLHEEPHVPNYVDPKVTIRGCGRAWCSPSSRWFAPERPKRACCRTVGRPSPWRFAGRAL